jgi:Zn-dependent peptidase ImmA (M78 family)
MQSIEINAGRIEYLVELFGLDRDEFLERISSKLKKPLTKEQIFTQHIKLDHLKRVDKLFKKGLSFYTDPTPIRKEERSSIFFRKDRFNVELGIGDRKRVSKIEDSISSLTAIAKLSGMDVFFERKLERYDVQDNACEVARKIREELYPQSKSSDDRNFLIKLIGKFAEQNILVHEFVEAWNLKEKSNINGFFIQPNHITIKRNQRAIKREIFTLAHELGHYILDQEELDQINFQNREDSTSIERWCNNFAFYFLMDNESIDGLHRSVRSKDNTDEDLFNAPVIRDIAKKNHISRLSLYTHLASEKKISWEQYENIKNFIHHENEVNEKKKQELLNEKQMAKGKKKGGGTPKPILSPLKKAIYTTGYFEGVIDEYEVLNNCAPTKKNTIEDIIYG